MFVSALLLRLFILTYECCEYFKFSSIYGRNRLDMTQSPLVPFFEGVDFSLPGQASIQKQGEMKK